MYPDADNGVEILHLPQGSAVDDVATPEQHNAAANQILQAVRRWTETEAYELHVCFSGGRKSMGVFVTQAMSLLARRTDDLWHVLLKTPAAYRFLEEMPSDVAPEMDSAPRRGERWVAHGPITVLEQPFLRVRALLPQDVLARTAEFHEVLNLAQVLLADRAGETRLCIDADSQFTVYEPGGHRVALPKESGRGLAFWTLVARYANQFGRDEEALETWAMPPSFDAIWAARLKTIATSYGWSLNEPKYLRSNIDLRGDAKHVNQWLQMKDYQWRFGLHTKEGAYRCVSFNPAHWVTPAQMARELAVGADAEEGAMRHILFAVVGLSPGVILNTLWQLFHRHGIVAGGIHIVTTKKGREAIEAKGLRACIRLFNDWLRGVAHQSHAEWVLADTFDEAALSGVEVVSLSGQMDIDDVDTPTAYRAMADRIFARLQQWVQQQDVRLHVSIAGGRTSMSVLVAQAMMAIGDHRQTISHVVVDDAREGELDGQQPYPLEYPVSAGEAVNFPVQYAEQPTLRLGSFNVGDYQPTAGFRSLVEAQQFRTDLIAGDVKLTIDNKTSTVIVRSRYSAEVAQVEFGLQPRRCAFYEYLLMHHNLAKGQTPLPLRNNPSHDVCPWSEFDRGFAQLLENKQGLRGELVFESFDGLSLDSLSPEWALSEELREAVDPDLKVQRRKLANKRLSKSERKAVEGRVREHRFVSLSRIQHALNRADLSTQDREALEEVKGRALSVLKHAVQQQQLASRTNDQLLSGLGLAGKASQLAIVADAPSEPTASYAVNVAHFVGVFE